MVTRLLLNSSLYVTCFKKKIILIFFFSMLQQVTAGYILYGNKVTLQLHITCQDGYRL
jgi:fructose-1,6-bisphosphatase